MSEDRVKLAKAILRGKMKEWGERCNVQTSRARYYGDDKQPFMVVTSRGELDGESLASAKPHSDVWRTLAYMPHEDPVACAHSFGWVMESLISTGTFKDPPTIVWKIKPYMEELFPGGFLVRARCVVIPSYKVPIAPDRVVAITVAKRKPRRRSGQQIAH